MRIKVNVDHPRNTAVVDPLLKNREAKELIDDSQALDFVFHPKGLFSANKP